MSIMSELPATQADVPAPPAQPGELVQLTLRIFARQWWQWVVLSVLGFIPVAVLLAVAFQVSTSLVTESPDALLSDPTALIGPLVLTLVLSVGVALFQRLMLGGAGAVLATAGLRGQRGSLGAAIRTAFVERGGALVLGYVYVGGLLLLVMAGSVLAIAICIGVVGFWVAFYAFIVWTPLLATVLVLERGPLQVLLARAWYFGKKRIWWMVGGLLAVAAWEAVVNLPVQLAVNGAVDSLVGETMTQFEFEQYFGQLLALSLVASFIVQTLTVPLSVIFFTLIYHGTRLELNPAAVEKYEAYTEAGGSFGSSARAQALEEFPPPPEPYFTQADLPGVLGAPLLFFAVAFVIGSVFSSGLLGGFGL